MTGRQESVLALDTATDDTVVGAAAGGEVLRGAAVPPGEDGRPRHAAALLVETERAVEAAGGWEAVGRIGIGVGPGSYTGMRIGIATGRALAQARGIETAAIGTLTALARGISDRGGGERACLAVIDARRGEVFVQLHDGAGQPMTDATVLAPARLGEWLAAAGNDGRAEGAAAPLAAGSGAVRFPSELESAGVEVLPADDEAHRLAARHLCAVAALAEPSRPERIRPVYLREPDAKRWLERDRDQAAGL